jgi:NTE family protein
LPRGFRAGQFRRLKLHRIVMEDMAEAFATRGPLKTGYKHFQTLRKLGQRAARRFLDLHFDDIGRRSTLDVTAKLEPELVE